MTQKLFSLEPAEVSLVGKAANKKKFLVFKSAEGKNGMKPNATIEALRKQVDAKTMAKIDEILKTAPPANSGMTPEDQPPKKDSATFKEDEHKPMSDRAQAAMKAAARILAPHKDEIHAGHVDAMTKEIGLQPGHATVKPEDEGPGGGKEAGMMNQPQDVKEEHHMAALDEATKAYGAHLEKMGYQKYKQEEPTQKSKDHKDDDDDDGGEDVSKSLKNLDLSKLDASVRAPLELIFKANEELVQKNAALEKDLKEQRDQRKLDECREKVKSFSHLGADSEELATVLKSLSDKDPESAGKVEAVLKAANAQLKAGGGLYGELGSRVSKSADNGSPEGKMRAMVDSYVAKSDGSKSREQIADDLFVNNKEYKRLYGEYMANHPGMKGQS